MTATPNFICVGAARCGTTSLWGWFKQHPLVHMSPVKETNYFARDLVGREGPGDSEAIADIRLKDLSGVPSMHAGIVHDEATYRAALTGKAGQHCGEISPSYLFYACQTAPRIYAFNPNCKIIILLREPISRALSQHAIFTEAGRENLSFKEAIDSEEIRLNSGWDFGRAYVGLGLYYRSVRTYIDVFGRENVWIGLYDDLQIDPQSTFEMICKFLDIP